MVGRLTPVQKVACSNQILRQLFYQFLRVDAFDIISIIMCACNETLTCGLAAQRSASVSSSEGCVFKSQLGQLFYQFL